MANSKIARSCRLPVGALGESHVTANFGLGVVAPPHSSVASAQLRFVYVCVNPSLQVFCEFPRDRKVNRQMSAQTEMLEG